MANSPSNTLLMACRQDQLDVITACVESGDVDINVCDDVDGKSPLCVAITWKCKVGTIRYLIHKGADLRRCNKTESALILACRIGHYQAAHVCIESGCDVNQRTFDSKYETALHILLRKFHTLVQVGHSIRIEHFHAFSEQMAQVLALCERLSSSPHYLHLDIPDIYGKTVCDMIRYPGFLGKMATLSDEERFREALLYPHLPPPLSCLAAQQCAKIYYSCFVLPSKLQEFVTLHLKPSDIYLPHTVSSGSRGRGVKRGKMDTLTRLWRNMLIRLKS